MSYTEKVRKYAGILPIERATEQAIDECINEGILSDFLSRNRAEAYKVSIYEFDEMKYREAMLEEGRMEGRQEGRQEGLRGSMQEFEECLRLGLSLEEALDRVRKKYASIVSL